MILLDLNKIFDPLGFLLPVLIMGKLFLQQMWAMKIDWDSQLPHNMQEKWIEFYHSLEQLKGCSVPRKVKPSATDEIEIHGFCDASEEAYGACIYVSSRDCNGKWQSKLLCAKTRVAPLKGATIPRLKLNGALLLAELINKVAQSWTIEVQDSRLWTDSMVVLTWLNSQRGCLKTCIRILNRVNQILELTRITQWNHVRTIENRADVITRGLSSTELLAAKTWWNGPKWMSTIAIYWTPSLV